MTAAPTTRCSVSIHAAMADNSVRLLGEGMSLRVFYALGTRDNGEIVSVDQN